MCVTKELINDIEWPIKIQINFIYIFASIPCQAYYVYIVDVFIFRLCNTLYAKMALISMSNLCNRQSCTPSVKINKLNQLNMRRKNSYLNSLCHSFVDLALTSHFITIHCGRFVIFKFLF